RQHTGWLDLTGLDQPRNAGRQHARLAGARAGENERVLRRQTDRLKLFGIEIGEEIGHAPHCNRAAVRFAAQAALAEAQCLGTGKPNGAALAGENAYPLAPEAARTGPE